LKTKLECVFVQWTAIHVVDHGYRASWSADGVGTAIHVIRNSWGRGLHCI